MNEDAVRSYVCEVTGWSTATTLTVKRFDSGERHAVYRVTHVSPDGQRDLVVRVCLSDTADERTKVVREARVLERVQGVAAPRLRDFRLESRWFGAPCMAMEFVPGDQRDLAATQPADLERLGRLVGGLHSLSVDDLADVSAPAHDAAAYRAGRIEQLANYMRWVRDPLPRSVQDRVQRAMSAVNEGSRAGANGTDLVLLHGDIAGGNIIWGAEPVLIDWEYARVGDAADEIAYLFGQNGLTSAQRDAFLRGYAFLHGSVEQMIERIRWWEPVTLLGSALWWFERATRRADSDAVGRVDPDAPRTTDHYMTQALQRLDRFEARLQRAGREEVELAERQLDGGIANAGRVVRVGQHVLRPSGPHTTSVHAFLRALRDAGFEGAPTPVGVDEDGRERLVFIDGDVPLTPYPLWSQSDAALASIAQLLRRMHDAAGAFDPQGCTWNVALADPAGGTVVCHNDLELSNIVFREGVAVALIDFEFAAPGRPIYDLAQLARFCVPIDDDFEQSRLGWRPADRPARLRLVADAYRLDRDGRASLLAAMDDAIDRIEAAVRAAVQAGDANSIALWNRSGGDQKFVRRRRWWSDHLHEFAAALT